MDKINLLDFKPEMRVKYLGHTKNGRGMPYHGQLATVIRPIKSRKVVHIRWDLAGESSFEASPKNLEILLDNPAIVRNIIEVNP